MRNPLVVMLGWEISVFLRSKILLFWNFAFPILMFLVLVSAFGGPTSLGRVQLGVSDADHTDASAAYVGVLQRVFATNEAVVATIRPVQGAETRLTVEIPKGFAAPLASGAPADLVVASPHRLSLAERTAAQIVRSVTTEFELTARTTRRALHVTQRVGTGGGGVASLSYKDYVATGIVVMTLLSVCTIGIIIPLVARREAGVMRAFQCLPLAPDMLVGAVIASRLLVCVVFTVVFGGCVAAIHRLDIHYSLPAALRLLVLVVLGALVFSFIGLACASRLRSVVVASAVANLVYFPFASSGT